MRYRIQEAITKYNMNNHNGLIVLNMAKLSAMVITDRTKRNGEPITDGRKKQLISDWNAGNQRYAQPTDKELQAIADITGVPVNFLTNDK